MGMHPVVFPLTPALSPEERESVTRCFGNWNVLGFDPALRLLGEKSAGMSERIRVWNIARFCRGRRTLPSLLGGEGWGEGEQGALIM